MYSMTTKQGSLAEQKRNGVAGKFGAKTTTAPTGTLAAPETREFTHADQKAATNAFLVAAVELDVYDEDGVPGSDGAAGECSIHDFDPDTRAELEEDVSSFLESNAPLIREAMDKQPGYTLESVGNDFWLTRQGHGAGFWDRGLGEIGEKLSDQARVYGGKDLFLGDDGRIAG